MHNGSEHMIFHQINQLASTTRSNQHYKQPTGTNPRLRDKNWIQVMNQDLRGDGAGEDVDEDWPLPDESSVGDDDGEAEQLCRSPRLVPPRFRLVAAEFLPESLLMIFFQGKRPHIAEDGHQRAARGPTRQGGAQGVGRAPPSWMVGGPPLVLLVLSIFYIF